MQIIDNRALLVRTTTPEQITSTIRKSRQTGDEEVAVYWGLKEAQLLTSLGFTVPSLIERDYKWSGKRKPFDHQRVTAGFLTHNPKAFCFSEQGLGKTATVIWAADYLMNIGKVRRVLIVCPLSIMKPAWQADLFSFAMHRSCSVAYGDAKARAKIIKAGSEFVIINPDGLAIVKQEILDGGFDLIVADESTFLKNPTTRRWKTFHDISKGVEWLWLLTGTPAAQSPVDAYGLAKLVNPAGCPKFFGSFRDSVMMKVSQFRWVAKPNAKDVVHKVLQPAIRFERKDCLDLPEVIHVDREAPMTPMQKKYYDLLRTQLLFEADGEEVSAVNAAVKLNKLLQISCIAKHTPVLTRSGWVPIQLVTELDEVWDGLEWVRCGGAVCNGIRPTLLLDGVRMTPDHRVLTEGGWAEAKDCVHGDASERLKRANVRLPHGYTARGYQPARVRDVALSLCVRQGDSAALAEPEKYKPEKSKKELRMPVGGVQHNPWHDGYPTVQHMGKNAASLREYLRQRLQKLRGARHKSIARLGYVLRGILGGHEPYLSTRVNSGTYGQRRSVFQRQLPVGDLRTASEQYATQSLLGHPRWGHDYSAGGAALWNKADNSARTDTPLRVEHLPRAHYRDKSRELRTDETRAETYDVLNCGPRSRFVVQGPEGQLVIVHNCGAIYSESSEVVEFDVNNRLAVVKEVIEESSHKVLVFVPFTHTIELLERYLTSEGISCAVINGSVPVNKRAQIVADFQTKTAPHVLIIQPQAAAHGLTLTAANTIIWYAPVTSVETYLQANARINRPGQKNEMLVVHIAGSDVERRVYSMLRSNVDEHEKIIDLYKQVILTK